MSPRHIDQDTLDARENEILDQALKIIEEKGMAFLTIDKLVANVNYSKGTVYNHFSSKEDVFTALCNRNMRSLERLFQRAASIDESARHKMMGIGFAYMLSVLLTPQSFTLMMNAKTEIFENASPKRREEHEYLDGMLYRTCCDVVEEGIRQEELSLAEGMEIHDVSFSVYAMTFGTIGLMLKKDRRCSSLVSGVLEDRVISHGNLVMNGLGWKQPEKADDDVVKQLKSETFRHEIDILSKRESEGKSGNKSEEESELT